jgi:hypothetical protein
MSEPMPVFMSFNACVKVDSQGSRVTSDAGLILVWGWMNIWDSARRELQSPAFMISFAPVVGPTDAA